MDSIQLKIGMPAGSLASASRGGNLVDLLAAAGFRTSGYDKGGPTTASFRWTQSSARYGISDATRRIGVRGAIAFR